VGHVAWQCPRGSYHINADAVIVEVLDDGDNPVASGESGHLVLTALRRTATPAIRYRIGDVGRLAPGPCACGLALPVMAQPEGRYADCLIAHDGRRVSPMRFALVNVGPYHDKVRRWQLTQREIGDLLVEIVFRDEPIPDLAQQMSATWSPVLGGPVDVELRAVDRIVTRPGAKFRWVRRAMP